MKRTVPYNRIKWWTGISLSCSLSLFLRGSSVTLPVRSLHTQRENVASLIHCFCLFLFVFNCFAIRSVSLLGRVGNVSASLRYVCFDGVNVCWTDIFQSCHHLFSKQNKGGAFVLLALVWQSQLSIQSFIWVQLRPMDFHTKISIHTHKALEWSFARGWFLHHPQPPDKRSSVAQGLT